MNVSIHLIESHQSHYKVFGYLNKDRFFIMEISKDILEIRSFRLDSTLLKQNQYDYIYACAVQAIKYNLVYIREVKDVASEDIEITSSNNLVDEIIQRGRNQGMVDQLLKLQSAG